MGNIQKGSKVPFTLSVNANSLGESTLSASDFKVHFYAKAKKDSAITAYYTVKKGDDGVVIDQSDPNTCYMICDTTNLDLGTIGATLEVEYTDTNTEKPAKEIIELTSSDKIIEPQMPEEQVEQQEEEVEPQGE